MNITKTLGIASGAALLVVGCGSPEGEPLPAATLPGIEKDRLFEDTLTTECVGICEPAQVGGLAVAERLGNATPIETTTTTIDIDTNPAPAPAPGGGGPIDDPNCSPTNVTDENGNIVAVICI